MVGRVPSEPGSRASTEPQSSQGLGPSGFDPSRIRRPGLGERLEQFEAALFEVRWAAERVIAGQQFNAYERSNPDADFDDDEFEEDEDEIEFALCLGPIADRRFICDIIGRGQAMLVEAALKVATEAFLEKARDSDGSPKGGDSETGSVRSTTARAEGIAPDSPPALKSEEQ